ncbi:MAG: acetyltransferase [Nevskiales bacterium]
MTQPLLILSAAGTAAELRERIEASAQYLFRGFLDDVKTGPDIVGTLADQARHADCKLMSALGSYRGMSRRARLLRDIPPERFARFVDPLALCSASAQLGIDVVVFPFSVIAARAVLGAHCLVYHHATVSHDCELGAGVIISNAACLSGHVRVGSHAYVGAGAVIRENVRIGSHTIIAANATVSNDVPDQVIYLSKDRIESNHYHTP